MIRKWISLSVFLCFSVLDSYALDVRVGDSTIAIPTPAGFYSITSGDTDTFQTFETFCPPTNRLLVALLPEKDDNSVSHLMAQSFKSLEHTTLSALDFARLREMIKSQAQSNLNGARQEAEDVLSARHGTKLKLGDVVFLGINAESDTYISMSMLAKYLVGSGDDAVVETMAGTMIVIFVKGQVLYLYAYGIFESHEDIEHTRNIAAEWASELVSANSSTSNADPEVATVPPETKSTQDFHDADAVVGKRTAPTLAGLLVVLITLGVILIVPIAIAKLASRTRSQRTNAIEKSPCNPVPPEVISERSKGEILSKCPRCDEIVHVYYWHLKRMSLKCGSCGYTMGLAPTCVQKAELMDYRERVEKGECPSCMKKLPTRGRYCGKCGARVRK